MKQRIAPAAGNRGRRRVALAILAAVGVIAAAPAVAQTPIAYGETLAGELAIAGEFDTFTFSASAGDVVLLRLAEVSSGLEPRLRLLGPGGAELHDTYDYTLAELNAISLPASGLYSITVSDHQDDETGEYRLHLQRVDDPAGATTLAFGATVAATIVDRAATTAFRLSAEADDRVLLRLGEVDSDLYPQLRIYDPAGAQLTVASGNPTAEINAAVMPGSGTYTVLVLDNPGVNVGELRLHAQCTNDPALATTVAYGETLAGTLTERAETLAYRVTAAAGDRILARLAEISSALEPRLRIYDAAGDMIANTYDYTVAELDAHQLPVAGTYLLLALDHQGDETGDLSLHVQRTHDAAGATALSLGAVHGGSLGARAETAAFTVTAAANDRLLLRLGEVSADLYPQLRIYDPSGQLLAIQSGNPTAELNALAVPVGGTYTVLAMDNPGVNVGEYRIHCQCLNDPALATPIAYGQTLPANLPDRTATRAYRFSAGAGDRILARLAEVSSGLEPRLRLYDGAGDMIANGYDYTVVEFDAFELPGTGVFTLLVLDHQGDESGDLMLHLQRTHAAAGAVPIGFGDNLPGTIASAAATVAFSVTCVADDRLLLRLGELDADLYPQLRVYDPGGARIAIQSGNPMAELNAVVVPASGELTVIALDNPGVHPGDFRLHLQRLDDPVGATPIAYGDTRAGAIDLIADSAAFTFAGSAGDRILVRLAELTSVLEPRLRIHDAAGDMIANLYDYTVADLNAFELPATGQYTLLALDHQGDETGSVSLHLQRTHAAAGTSPIGFGETLAGELEAAAASVAFSFEAEAGDRILLRLGELTSDLYPQLRVYDPAGEPVTSGSGNPTCDIDPCEIEAAGTHTVLAMDNPGVHVGEFRLHVQRLNAPGLAIPVTYTTSRDDSIDEIAQTIAYTFTASGGDSITATMTEITAILEPRLRLYAPDGTRLANGYDYTSFVLGQRLPSSGTYTILAMDHQGDETGAYHFALTAIATAVPDLPPEITAFAFHGSHPNPFNPRTRFVFDLPEALPVVLTIYGVDGRRLCRLLDETLPRGRHEVSWNGRDDAGRNLPSGSYVGLLQAGPHRRTQRLTLVR